MLIVTFLHFFVALIGLPLFIRAVRVPRGVLFPLVIVLCVTGAFVATASIFDTFVMLGFGGLGYLMVKFGFPIAPMLIGFILGPLIEMSLRQSLILSGNSPEIFFTRPVSAVFLTLTAIIVVTVGWQRFRELKQNEN
jgi:putative tricarboxylic transport membrane protein